MRHTIAMALTAVTLTVQAQSTTYNHDPMKMNQITVMESGSGQLQPAWYYNLLHENYSKGAASTNKAMYRTEAGGVLYLQLPTGDSIKTYLEKRAEDFYKLSDKIWENAEIRFKEKQSVKDYVAFLKNEGFSITVGEAGLKTGFHAEWGKRKACDWFSGRV